MSKSRNESARAFMAHPKRALETNAFAHLVNQTIAKSIREGLLRWNAEDDTIQLTARGELMAKRAGPLTDAEVAHMRGALRETIN